MRFLPVFLKIAFDPHSANFLLKVAKHVTGSNLTGSLARLPVQGIQSIMAAEAWGGVCSDLSGQDSGSSINKEASTHSLPMPARPQAPKFSQSPQTVPLAGDQLFTHQLWAHFLLKPIVCHRPYRIQSSLMQNKSSSYFRKSQRLTVPTLLKNQHLLRAEVILWLWPL